MKTYDVFKEYIWLVNTIRKAKRISLAEINDKWRDVDMSGGVDFARATFNRHKDAIQDIFGIYIECDRKNGNKPGDDNLKGTKYEDLLCEDTDFMLNCEKAANKIAHKELGKEIDIELYMMYDNHCYFRPVLSYLKEKEYRYPVPLVSR